MNEVWNAALARQQPCDRPCSARAHRSDADNKNAPVHLPGAGVRSERRALNAHNGSLHMPNYFHFIRIYWAMFVYNM